MTSRAAQFQVDVKEWVGVGRGSDINVQLTLRGEKVKMSTAPKYVAPCVSPKCVSIWLFSSKPSLFPLESSLNFVIHRGNHEFISLPVTFHYGPK